MQVYAVHNACLRSLLSVHNFFHNVPPRVTLGEIGVRVKVAVLEQK